MGLFGIGKKKRSKEEEDLEEDDEDEEDELERRKKKKLKERKEFSKKLKDLNSDEAKKRKEPPKPWGPKERIWVLTLLFVTTAVPGFLALRARDYKLPGLPRIKMPVLFSGLAGVFKGETIVIEGDPEDNGRSEEIIKSLDEYTRGLSGTYGIYVVRLSDSSSYGINEDETFLAASMIKLPVMIGMYLEEETTDFSLNQKYKLKEADKLPGAGSLAGKPAGYEITYRSLIRLMAKESDNTAYNISRKFLGDGKINGIIADIGMTNTNFAQNESTPKDIGNLFAKLDQGRLINEKNKNELIGYLTGTLYEEWLPKGLPDEVKIAHKVGIELHVVNDGGIVQSASPYVVVVMTKGIVEREAVEALPEISRIIFSAETGSLD